MGHDTHHHLWALWGVWRTVLDGDWTPRWIPYLGTGMPDFTAMSPNVFLRGHQGRFVDQTFASVMQAKTATKNAIKLYNSKRLHLSLEYKTPNYVHQYAA